MAKSNSGPAPLTLGTVRVKPGVQFTTIAPAGFALLGAIESAARQCRVDVTITSACDGAHSGPDDPHHRGEAYDVRTHDLGDAIKQSLCYRIVDALRRNDEPAAVPIEGVARSFATARFFAFIESAGSPDEHLHVQLRRGRVYP